MELALTFGAIGDFLSIALLIKDIVSAFDESRGSAKAYRGLIDEITQLHKALEQIDHIYRGPDIPSGLNDLISIAQTTVAQVHETLKTFHGRICKKYGDSLAGGGSGNIFLDAAKKIQFKLEEKDVANFRTELAGHRMSLELFLQITIVRFEKENYKAVMTQLSETAERTTAVVHRYGYSIESRLGFLGRCILSKLDFVARLGIDMTQSASQILSMMFAVSGDLSIIRSVVLRLDRGVNNGEHFVLEDATGRSFPIHMKTITSWEAFSFILEDRFKGKKGERRTRRKLYSLHESASHLEIDRSVHFEAAFLPYQKVDMSLICKAPVAPTAEDGDTGLSSCPWCKTVSPGKLGDRVQCSTCRRDFLRVVIEVEDSEVPLTPPSAPVPQRIADVQFDDEACNECHRPKRSKAAQVDDRKRMRSGEPNSDSESDEENLAGLAHVTLQTKRMRLSELEKRPFHAVQADSFDILARKVLGDNPVAFTALSIDSKNGERRSRFAGDAGKTIAAMAGNQGNLIIVVGHPGVELQKKEAIFSEVRRISEVIDDYNMDRPKGWEKRVAQENQKLVLFEAMRKILAEEGSPHRKKWDLELLIASDQVELGELEAEAVAKGLPPATVEAQTLKLKERIQKLNADLDAISC